MINYMNTANYCRRMLIMETFIMLVGIMFAVCMSVADDTNYVSIGSVTSGGSNNMDFSSMSVKIDYDATVKALAKEGRICKVYGHMWRDGRPGEGDGMVFADYHPDTVYRTCRICGKCESMSINNWK